MTASLCTQCGGKGFHWKVGKIISRVDASEKATTYAHGPKCENCLGTGYEQGQLVTFFSDMTGAKLVFCALTLCAILAALLLGSSI